MSIRTTSPFTYEDFVHFPDDGQRYELVDGEVYVTPAPSTRHQAIVLRIARFIADHLDQHGGGRVFVGPVDIVLSDTNVVEPDVVVVAAAEVGRITKPNIQGPPTLAVEVLSDPRHDRVRKRRLYARFGVPEYWIVDPDGDRVEVHRLAEGTPAACPNGVDEYPTPTILEPGATLTTDLLPGLEIDVADLLAEDG
jgi:Uma2 family endonuclease